MATNVVELRAPRDSEGLNDLLEQVTIRSAEDIHDAAVAIARIAESYGMQVSMCDDISSKETMLDTDGTILNADVFGWVADGERWWEDHRLALS